MTKEWPQIIVQCCSRYHRAQLLGCCNISVKLFSAMLWKSIRTCWSSRVLVFRLNSKTQWQAFLWLYGRYVCQPRSQDLYLGSPRGTNMAPLYTKLYEFGWNTSPNNARMKQPHRSQSWQGCLLQPSIINIILKIEHSAKQNCLYL